MIRSDRVQATKDYLCQVININEEIESKKRLRNDAIESLTTISATRLKEINVQEQPLETNEDRMVEYADMSVIIDDMIKDLSKKQEKILKEIDKLENRIHKTILIERYMRSQSWEEIAEQLGYDKRHVTRLHGNALQEFYELNKKVVDDYTEKNMS